MVLKAGTPVGASEDKIYPTLIRMACCYNGLSFMVKVIGKKYEETDNATEIRSKLMNGDYFIHWDLKTNKKQPTYNCVTRDQLTSRQTQAPFTGIPTCLSFFI